jgi:threonine aldolase
MLGGGLRQAGSLAAAGLYALDHHVTRLRDDHRRATQLGEGLSTLGYTVLRCATNMVFVRAPSSFADFMSAAGFGISDAPVLRLVTHLDISDADIEAFLERAADFPGERSA